MNNRRNIFYFNPTCELAVANGSPYYQAPALLCEFEETLSPLMLWFAGQNDFVVVDQLPTKHFLEESKNFGFPLAPFYTKEHAFQLIKEETKPIKLMPWGWSPAIINHFKELIPYSQSISVAEPVQLKRRYERKNSLELLSQVLNKFKSPHLLDKSRRPQAIKSETEIEELLEKWDQIVLKSPLSSSGRGLQMIRFKPLNDSKRKWIQTILKQQGYITCEPLLQKCADFSFQFKICEDHRVEYIGLSYFKTNANGQYQGHYLNKIPEFIHAFEKQLNSNLIEELAEYIRNYLESSEFSKQESYIGVDALIYKDGEQLKLYPCVEINPRLNMGILSLKLQSRIYERSTGYFEIYNGKNYAEFAKKMEKENPQVCINGKPSCGFFSLTEKNNGQRFGAFMQLYADQ